MKTKSGMTRRILAVFCVVCMAALQCMVVLPAMTEDVHAADPKVDFTADYNGIQGTRSNSSWITTANSKQIEILPEEKDEEGNVISEAVVVTGYQLSSILKNAKLSSCNEVYAGMDIADRGSAYLYKNKDSNTWQLYYEDMDQGIVVDEIYAVMGKYPIKIKSAKASDTKPVKGQKVTINYSLEVDEFFKGTDEYKDNKEDYLSIDWTASNSKVSPTSTNTASTSGNFTLEVKSSGKVTITPQSGYLNNSVKITLSGKEPKLTATPSKVKLKVNEIKTITVKDDSGTVSYSYLTWSSSNSKVASVTSSGVIRGLSKGTATVTVKSSAPSSKGKTAKVSVTVSSSSSGGSGGYTSYRPTNRTGGTITRATVKRPSTTATRPTTPGQTLTPSFQTMTVKEVYLTSTNPYEGAEYYDEYGNPVDEYGDPIDEDEWDEEDEDWDEDGVSVPQAAGSAAVAAAACGAGVVGRIRRFKFDMSSAAIAAVVGKTTAAGGKGKNNSGRNSKADEAKDEVGKKAGKKESRNPLNKIRRK